MSVDELGHIVVASSPSETLVGSQEAGDAPEIVAVTISLHSPRDLADIDELSVLTQLWKQTFFDSRQDFQK